MDMDDLMHSDLAFMLQDAPGSVQVLCGAEKGSGLLMEASKLSNVPDGRLEVSGVERALVFDPRQLPSIQKGATLTAGGKSFKVLRPVSVREDGSAHALLGKP